MERDLNLERIGGAILLRRRHLRLSQEALAQRSGLYRTHLGRIERGQMNITMLNLLAIAQALDMTAAALLADAGV